MHEQISSISVIWIAFLLIGYAGFCIFWGSRHASGIITATDFFVGGRSLPSWVFIPALSTASFSGWIFVAQPGLVLRDGFPAAYLSFCAVIVPLGGVFFLKRQWILGRRFGFVTPGELYSAYYDSEIPRFFTVLLALLFAIPVVGASLGAAGALVSNVTGGWLSREATMWLFATLTLIYISSGGMRSFAYVCTLQALLIAVGVSILGLAAFSLTGGFEALTKALANIAATQIPDASTTNGYGGGNFNSWFAISGVVQFTSGLEREVPAGGLWTSAMVLSFLVAFLGVQMSPAFSMLAFSMTDTKSLSAQQVWFSAFGVGALLFIFATLQGVGAYLLGADGNISNAGQALGSHFPPLSDGWHGQVVAILIELVGQASPFIGAVVAIGFAVALTAACGVYVLSSAAVLSRDVFVPYFRFGADERTQIMFSRVLMLLLTVAALLIATFAREGMIALWALALSLSLQLLPTLAGISWLPWLSRHAVNAGLLVGSICVVLTGEFGQYLTNGGLPWGQSPWTIYPALWGIVANAVTCTIVVLLSPDSEPTGFQEISHGFLKDHDQSPKKIRGLNSAAWVAILAWVFFAIGPGAVFGNWLFGSPSSGLEQWNFQIPSIWAWQVIWWGVGVLLVWLLAAGLGLSRAAQGGPIQPIANDVLSLREPTSVQQFNTVRNQSDNIEIRQKTLPSISE